MLAFGTSTATTAPAMLGGTSARALLGEYLKQPAIYLYFRRDYPPPLVASGQAWLNQVKSVLRPAGQ